MKDIPICRPSSRRCAGHVFNIFPVLSKLEPEGWRSKSYLSMGIWTLKQNGRFFSDLKNKAALMLFSLYETCLITYRNRGRNHPFFASRPDFFYTAESLHPPRAFKIYSMYFGAYKDQGYFNKVGYPHSHVSGEGRKGCHGSPPYFTLSAR